jgi:nitroimidazol reductase NimA-like FMN-containing flavoprotein (pyridoxamine 5'-phosphate oxidase superfamily)
MKKYFCCYHAFIADGYIKYNEGEDPYYLHLNYGWGDGNFHRDAYVLSAKKSWKIEEARKEYKRQNIIYHYDTKYFTYAYTNEVNW